jgi:hypothetical protein
LCSRRLMFWRFALRADFVRLAKQSSQIYGTVKRDARTTNYEPDS